MITGMGSCHGMLQVTSRDRHVHNCLYLWTRDPYSACVMMHVDGQVSGG